MNGISCIIIKKGSKYVIIQFTGSYKNIQKLNYKI